MIHDSPFCDRLMQTMLMLSWEEDWCDLRVCSRSLIYISWYHTVEETCLYLRAWILCLQKLTWNAQSVVTMKMILSLPQWEWPVDLWPSLIVMSQWRGRGLTQREFPIEIWDCVNLCVPIKLFFFLPNKPVCFSEPHFGFCRGELISKKTRTWRSQYLVSEWDLREASGLRQRLTLRYIWADGPLTASHRCLCPSMIHKHKTLLPPLACHGRRSRDSYLTRRRHADHSMERMERMWRPTRTDAIGQVGHSMVQRAQCGTLPAASWPLVARNIWDCFGPTHQVFHAATPPGLHSGTRVWSLSLRLSGFPFSPSSPENLTLILGEALFSSFYLF